VIRKQKAVMVHPGFYVIIPPEFRTKGILPPVYFVADLMKFLKRPYYVSLLSAAALHGAAHQQPMKYFVSIDKPPMRSKHLVGLSIDFVVTRAIPEKLLVEKKTPAGFIRVSNPILTASDLLEFPKRIGGWERALELAEDLTEFISPDMINEYFVHHVKHVTLQRLGYFWEFLKPVPKLANKLWKLAQEKQIQLFPLAWPVDRSNNEKAVSNRWQVRVTQ
jgi:predicted transcriptional regulator of viral defense system